MAGGGSYPVPIDIAPSQDDADHENIVPIKKAGQVKEEHDPLLDLKSVLWDEFYGPVSKHWNALKKRTGMNLDNLQLLGAGGQGQAFTDGSKKVLKLTKDPDEARTCFKLKGKNMRHVYMVHDVFRIPSEDTQVYGIVQEKLQPLSKTEVPNRQQFLVLRNIAEEIGKPATWKELIRYADEEHPDREPMLQAVFGKTDIPEMFDELAEQGIHFYDWHPGNIMKTYDGRWVVIDLGFSNGATQEPPELQEIVRRMIAEAVADKVGLVVMSFQPFHKGHGKIIRGLAQKYNKLIIACPDGKPFQYDTIYEMTKKSLSDVLPKLEMYRVKNDDVVEIIAGIIKNKDSTIEVGTAVNVLVPQNKFAAAKSRIDAERQKGGDIYIDPGLVTAMQIEGVQDDSNVGGVTSQQVLQALQKNDRRALDSLLDPHLVGVGIDMEKTIKELRGELGLNEGLYDDIMANATTDKEGEKPLNVQDNDIDAVLKQNAQKLAKKGINVSSLKSLGGGSHGVAYDIGNNRVLKVTDDQSEATASANVQGKLFKHIVKIFEVFSFPKSDAVGKFSNQLYGIVQEKLQPLSVKEQNEFQEMVVCVGTEKDVNRALASTKTYFPDKYEAVKAAIAKFNFPAILADLEKAHIEYNDFHGGNIMKRGNQYVIIDLGLSVSPAKNVPVLEDTDLAPTRKSGHQAQTDLATVGADKLMILMKQNRERLAKKGVDLDKISKLGNGQMGIAWDMGDGKRVFKITTDREEALSCMHLKGKSLKHVAKIFEVYRFPDPEQVAGGAGIYGIIEEKLQPLDHSEKIEFGWLSRMLHEIHPDHNAIAEAMWKGDTAEMTKILSNADENVVKPNITKVIFKFINKYKLYDMIDELKRMRINFIDYHEGNLMKRGGEYVINDIGRSLSPGGDPPMLESFFRSIFEEFSSDYQETGEWVKDDEVSKVIFDNLEGLTKKGIDPETMEQLGKGSNGIAYDIGENRVLKVTMDGSEARASNHIKGKDLKHVCKIFDVFKFKGKGKPFYGIIQEKLQPLSTQEQDELRKLTVVMEANAETEDIRSGNFEKIVSDYEKIDTKNGRKFRMMMVKFQINKMMKELASAGVSYGDYHDENIMKRGKDYVVIDLSAAQSAGGDPPVIENIEEDLKKLEGGEETILQVLEANKEKLARKGIHTWTRLGRGQMGVAFKIDGNKVLKVTTDKSEALTSFGIKGKSLKHVVKVFEVFKFDEAVMKSTEPLYGIVTETLTPLSPAEVQEFDYVSAFIRDDAVIDVLATGNFNDLIEQLRKVEYQDALQNMGAQMPENATLEQMMGQLQQMASQSKRAAKIAENLQKKLIRHEQDLKRFNIDVIMTELRQLGVKFADFHSGNLMKRGSDYVINDLGASRGATAEPPKLEHVIESIVNEIGITMAGGPGTTQTGLRAQSTQWSRGTKSDDEESDEEWGVLDPSHHAKS